MKIDDFEKLSLTEKQTLLMAKYIRDKMEEFHCNNLTDDHMKEINQIIRTAICEFLMIEKNEDLWLRSVAYMVYGIPNYWEIPNEKELLKKLKSTIGHWSKNLKI